MGPIDIGLGRFQEVACFHKPSHALLVTDALVGIGTQPPELFDLDPTPLLFHARDEGSQPLTDSPELRRKGWKRIVLFASFLKPSPLQIPSINKVLENSFKPGLRNWKSHFGIYPFEWQKGWDLSVDQIMGPTKPLLQVAPVIEKLVFPRAKKEFLRWLDEIKQLEGMKLLVPAHFSAPIIFTKRVCVSLRQKINFSIWGTSADEPSFLGSLDKSLLKLGVVPNDPLNKFKD